MTAPRDTPKWLGAQPLISVRERESVTSDDAALKSAYVHQDASKIAGLASWDEPTEKKIAFFVY